MAKTYIMHAMGVRKGMVFAHPHLKHFFERSGQIHRHFRHMLAHGLHRHHRQHKLMHHKHHEREHSNERHEVKGEGIHHKKRRPTPLRFNF